jgi:phosphoribosylamine---glycine ligase
MNVLVVGGGGREHALCWKLRRSPRVAALFCAPGNAGIARDATCVAIAADDVAGLLRFAKERAIELTVVGPELPLTLGIVDAFEAEGLRIFGPNRAGAELEGSKAFTKDLLRDAGIPTAAYGTFTDVGEARAFVARTGAPIVVKADGLAAGKGVVVAASAAEANEAIDAMLGRSAFGEAGSRIVVEEFLRGEEASFIAVTDGETVLPFDSSQDHKRIFDGDRGPNTGGMGAYSPAPVVTREIAAKVRTRILEPLVAGLRSRGIRYRGVLYAGLMIEDGEPRVLEFNARFGDPECQALLVRLKTDLVDVFEATIDGRLAGVALDWDPRPAVCVVAAAAGYPGTVRRGDAISGLDVFDGREDAVVFHAGTAARDGSTVTASGRVLGVTALGETIERAIARAYEGVDRIHFDGMQTRRDIGARAIGRTS